MKRKELTKTFMMILILKTPVVFMVCIEVFQRFNPFKPEFTIVKPRIAAAILDL